MDFYGKRVATASSDFTIKIFDVVGGNHVLTAQLGGHTGPVWRVAWGNPKFGTLLASCSYDRKVIMWREDAPGRWSKIFEDASAQQGVQSIAWAPESYGMMLAAASLDGQVSVFSYTDGKTWDHKRFPAHAGGVNAVSWSFSNAEVPVKRMVTAGCDNQCKVWIFMQEQGMWLQQKSFPAGAHSKWIKDVAWAPPTAGSNVQTLATGSDDQTVIIWSEDSVGSWKPLKKLSFSAPVCRVAWSIMGDILSVSLQRGPVSLFKQQNGDWQQVDTNGTPCSLLSVFFSLFFFPFFCLAFLFPLLESFSICYDAVHFFRQPMLCPYPSTSNSTSRNRRTVD